MEAQESSNVVQIGEWMVHPALDSISRGTETQKLEPRAMRLLLCLARSPGEVVSIERLLTDVWAGVVVGSASVYEAVSQLRKILGDVDPQPTYIATVPRKGYRLIAFVQRGTAAPVAAAAAVMQRKTTTSRRVWIIAGAFVLVGLVAAYLLVDKRGLLGHATSVVVSDKSIAVLPFTDMSEKKDQEYFADGMAEEIIDLLVRVPGLKVISRTSSFQFKGKSEDIRTIGTQLGVAYLLQGSVRKFGDRLRVTAQLIDSRDGADLLSQTYDRDLSDVLKMQDEIAANLVRVLQIEVTNGEMVSRPALRNTEAYTLYLQGQRASERFDQQGLEQAVDDFKRTLDLDPSFAAAALGLAGAYDALGTFGIMPAAAAFEQARQAAELALRLDPNLAIAHALLGSIHAVYDWDWPAGDRELKLARDLAPNDASILPLSAQQSLIMGRWDDALKQLNTSLEEDPLNPVSYLLLSVVQVRRGSLTEAEAAIRRTLEISPLYSRARYYLGVVLLARGQADASLAQMLKERDDVARLSGSAMAYFALGRKAESDAALAQLIKNHAGLHPFCVARVYGYRGESDEAFKWLDRAFTLRDTSLISIKNELPFARLEGDPRYKAFLKKMKLPEG